MVLVVAGRNVFTMATSPIWLLMGLTLILISSTTTTPAVVEAVPALSTITDEDSTVLVESPPLYIRRTPERRSKANNLDARPQVPEDASSSNGTSTSNNSSSTNNNNNINSGKNNNNHNTSKHHNINNNNNGRLYSDVEVSEMTSDEILLLRGSSGGSSGSTTDAESNNSNSSSTGSTGSVVELALKPGSRPFYLLLAGVLSTLLLVTIIAMWWWCLCRPKPVPRRYNPRYDGPPPKRLSKLSFRAMRYSITGNQQFRSSRYRTTEEHMEPAAAAAPPVSSIQTISNGAASSTS